jgi:hypothetical protein
MARDYDPWFAGSDVAEYIRSSFLLLENPIFYPVPFEKFFRDFRGLPLVPGRIGRVFSDKLGKKFDGFLPLGS